ncbi:MAG: hypothetical protein EZS28_035826, partial [Streblomastix strix]
MQNSKHQSRFHTKTCCFLLTSLVVVIGAFTVLMFPSFFYKFPIGIQSKPLCANQSLEFCQINSTQQFNKYIWMITDGTSYEYIEKLEKHFGEHAKVFVTHTERIRYSVELYKT